MKAWFGFWLGFCLVLLAAPAMAAINVTWDIVEAATGYKVYCEATPIGAGPYVADFTVQAPPVDIEAAAPVNVQTECWITAYAAAAESADSNHIVFTNPGPFQVIQMLTPPSTVNFQIIRTQP
jgi:hypothetical protein